ncbi:MAG: ligand-binding protein SH3 [Candidatus Omnitrophica bacterium]|nr:ligand-binding protein SH3 [Candidatus Omnitrophota bacterium]MBD3268766.1 ligand-binding protein SH3 [Candidatus Omnitrophota bacterium]
MSLPEWVLLFPRELAVVIISALPLLELRGAIPAGFYWEIPGCQVYLLAFIGNMLPVLPLLLIFRFFFEKLKNARFVGRFFRWWFSRVERNSRQFKRFGFWGVVFLVSIPLPVTGAWTGSVAATLFRLNVRRAFLAIALGVALAGILVTLLVNGITGLKELLNPGACLLIFPA